MPERRVWVFCSKTLLIYKRLGKLHSNHSFMFYIIIFLISLFLSVWIDCIKNNVIKGIFLTLLILFLSMIGGFRDIGVGTDTVTYSESYYYAAKEIHSLASLLDSGRDIGYLSLNLVAVYLESLWVAHFLGQLMTHGLILYVVYLLKKKYPQIQFSLFVFVYLMIFYNQTYNFMRQYCAIAVNMVGLYYLLQNKWGSFFVSLVISYFFHPSAVLFVIVAVYYYMCVYSKSKLYTWLAVLGAIASIILASKFYYFLAEFNDIGLISDTYSDRYGEGDKYGARSAFRPTVLLIFVGMFYLMYKAYSKKILKLPFVFFWCTLHISYITFSLLSFFSVYLYRLGLFFSVPDMMFASFLVASKKTNIAEKMLFCGIIFFDWFIYILLHNGAETLPYKSKILGIDGF